MVGNNAAQWRLTLPVIAQLWWKGASKLYMKLYYTTIPCFNIYLVQNKNHSRFSSHFSNHNNTIVALLQVRNTFLIVVRSLIASAACYYCWEERSSITHWKLYILIIFCSIKEQKNMTTFCTVNECVFMRLMIMECIRIESPFSTTTASSHTYIYIHSTNCK